MDPHAFGTKNPMSKSSMAVTQNTFSAQDSYPSLDRLPSLHRRRLSVINPTEQFVESVKCSPEARFVA